jgi:phage tail protein X
LAERLKKPGLRQLNQRISARGVLNPLNPEESRKYVECRLGAQGGKCAQIFAKGVLEYLLDHSGGIPRNINVLCHNAMLLAYSKGANRVDFKAARATTSEYGDSRTPTSGLRSSLRLVEKPALLIGGAFVLLLFGLVAMHERTAAPVREVTVSSARVTDEAASSGQNIKSTATFDHLPTHVAESTVSEGEVANPATKAEPAPSAVPEQRRQIRVRFGDTLEKLGIRYFGSKSGINELIDANPQLTDINRLSVGQIINLPSDDTAKTRSTSGGRAAPLEPPVVPEDAPANASAALRPSSPKASDRRHADAGNALSVGEAPASDGADN